MGIIELFLTAIGLSADAFAASLCQGLSMKYMKMKTALLTAGLFGLFQALMPLIGYFCASIFSGYIEKIDHYIAFLLLTLIGGKMIVDAVKERDNSTPESIGGELKELILLAVATSIDALAVGITFATLKVNILPAVILIGTVTFTLSFIGVGLGFKFGARMKTASGVIGGCVLVLIGTKILFEHLFIL